MAKTHLKVLVDILYIYIYIIQESYTYYIRRQTHVSPDLSLTFIHKNHRGKHHWFRQLTGERGEERSAEEV